jgi:hypothetical protein
VRFGRQPPTRFCPLALAAAASLTVGVSGVAGESQSGISGVDTLQQIAGPAARDPLALTASTLRVDRQGDVLYYETGASQVRKLSPCGTDTVLAGDPNARPNGPLADGPAAAANLKGIQGMSLGANGDIYLAQESRMVVRALSPVGTVTTFAGSADALEQSTGSGGHAIRATLSGPHDLATDRQGNVYILELSGVRVRKVRPDGTIDEFAGSGRRGFSGDDGKAVQATLGFAEGAGRVTTDGRGDAYILDGLRVRKVDPSGIITTVAGNGTRGSAGDGGPATKAELAAPSSIAADTEGDLYILDAYGVRKVNPAGTITTVVGSVTRNGWSGVGGPAKRALLDEPRDLALDGQGNLYISDGWRLLEVAHTPFAAAGPRLHLRGTRLQHPLTTRELRVSAGCDRPSTLTATGSITVPGAPSSFPLTRATAKLGAPGTKTLTLALSATTEAKLAKLLTTGKRGRASVTVKAVDRTGRTCTQRLVAPLSR